MNTTDISKNTAAPSVTIAPRNPARGVLLFVVTLTSPAQRSVRAAARKRISYHYQ
jgi:phage gp46-like protein